MLTENTLLFMSVLYFKQYYSFQLFLGLSLKTEILITSINNKIIVRSEKRKLYPLKNQDWFWIFPWVHDMIRKSYEF